MVTTTLVQDLSQVAYYAHDELCIVARGSAVPDYGTVQAVVNKEITARFAASGALDRFPILAKRSNGVNVLTALARWVPTSSAAKDPIVSFLRKDAGTTALHFYSVILDKSDTSLGVRQDAQERAASIRELVELLNDPPLNHDGARYVATPNWFSSAAQGDGPGVGGGPGTEPELPGDVTLGKVVVPPDQRFHFGNGQLEEMIHKQRLEAGAMAKKGPFQDAGVIVAILDTCPAPGAASAAVSNVRAKGFRNELLEEVTGQTQVGPVPRVSIDGILALDQKYFDRVVGNYIPDWPGRMPDAIGGNDRTRRFSIVDHGLFAAGIVKDIAPTVEIHLIQVLDECGVGDLLALAHTLVMLPTILLAGGNKGKHLVINLSLMLALPPMAELRQFWNNKVPNSIDLSLAEVIAWLDEQNILVVAAAGNDGLRLQPPPEPRRPALFETVLAVAALDQEGNRSNFSNLGDEEVIDDDTNAIATLGGRAVFRGVAASAGTVTGSGLNTVRQLHYDEVAGVGVAPASAGPDAVLGVFSARASSFSHVLDDTSWGWWGGTSFATPIITGIAAVLWRAYPGLSAQRVLGAIARGAFLGGQKPDLNCSYIVAFQQGQADWYR